MPVVVFIFVLIGLCLLWGAIVAFVEWWQETAWPAIATFWTETALPIIIGLFQLAVFVYVCYLIGWMIRDAVRAVRDVAEKWQDPKRTSPEHLGETRLRYMYGPVWRDLRDFHERNWYYARDDREAVIGMVPCVLMSAFAVVVVSLASAASWLWLGVFALADIVYLRARGLIATCPGCDAPRVAYLRYQCDRCGQMHVSLRPNRAGVFHHTCHGCGNKLASHVLSGRGNGLVTKCVSCEEQITDELVQGKATYMAFAGGADSGKSTMLTLLYDWLERQAPGARASIVFDDQVQRVELETAVKGMKNGVMPGKTANRRHRAYTLHINHPDHQLRSLYMYDMAGEVLADHQARQDHGYFRLADLVLFAIDPFSIKGAAARFRSEGLWDEIMHHSPSAMDPKSVGAALIGMLQSQTKLDKEGKITVPLHIVLTKTDIAGINGEIGSSHEGVRTWLTSNGAGPLVRELENNFSSVRYFFSASSAWSGMRDENFDRLAREAMKCVLPEEVFSEREATAGTP